MKLNINAFGLTIGIVAAACILLMLLIGLILPGYGNVMLRCLASIYPGFSATIGGSILGLIYGFVDGYIVGVAVAWLYNKLAKV